MLAKYWFLKKTNRTVFSLFNETHILDAVMFVGIVLWIHDEIRFMEYDPTNFYVTGNLDSHKNVMVNIIWAIHCSTAITDEELCKDSEKYRFDFVLATIVMIFWLKLFFSFRVTQVFGPLFKIM
jgi:hypothetical protein